MSPPTVRPDETAPPQTLAESASGGGDGLRGRTLEGVAWNLLGVGLRVVLQVLVLMLLARLLTAEDFGIVAAALVVVNLSTLLAEVGIGPALVQLPELRSEHIRAAFTAFVLLGVALWSLLWWQAGTIGDWFGIAELASVIPLMSSVFFIRNLTVGDWLLQRELAFRQLAILELQSYAVGFGLVAVGLAATGVGVMSIVAGHVTQAAVRTVLLWRRAPHTIRPSLRWTPLRQLLAFGSGHMLGRLLGYVAVQADNLVVGRWLGPVALGLYGRAYQLMVMPSELIGTVANRVLFPSLASVQHDRDRLGRAFLTGSVVLASMTVPVAAVAVLVSSELIIVVLGEEWLGLKPAFDIMAFGIVLRTGFKISDAVVQAIGAVYRHALRLVWYAAAVSIGAYVAHPWGITGVATAVLIALVGHYVLMTHLSLRLTGVRWGPFLVAHLPALITGAVTMAVVTPAVLGLRNAGASPLAVLGGAVVSTGIAAVAVLRLAPRLVVMERPTQLLHEVLDMLPGRPGRLARRIAGTGHPASEASAHMGER